MASSDASSLSFAISGGSSPTEPILSLMDAQKLLHQKQRPLLNQVCQFLQPFPRSRIFLFRCLDPSSEGWTLPHLDHPPRSGGSQSMQVRWPVPLRRLYCLTPPREDPALRGPLLLGTAKSGRRKRKIKRHDSRRKFPPSRGSSIRHPLTAPSQSLELHMTMSRSDRLS